MTTLTEARRNWEFIVSEQPGHRSREAKSVYSGGASTTIRGGTILGAPVDTDDSNWTVTNAGTGDGATTFNATPTGAGVKAGAYVAKMTGAGATAPFDLFDPDGLYVGAGAVGTEFVGPIVFTIADGGSNFAAGDTVTIEVPAAAHVRWNPDGADGSERVAGVLCEAVTGTVTTTVIVRDAEVNGHHLTYNDSATDAEKATAQAGLAALGIVVRS